MTGIGLIIGAVIFAIVVFAVAAKAFKLALGLGIVGVALLYIFSVFQAAGLSFTPNGIELKYTYENKAYTAILGSSDIEDFRVESMGKIVFKVKTHDGNTIEVPVEMDEKAMALFRNNLKNAVDSGKKIYDSGKELYDSVINTQNTTSTTVVEGGVGN